MEISGSRHLSRALHVVAASCACLAAPASASAVTWVRSVEYVEISLPAGVTTASATLTKGQNTANCVPFASETVAGVDATYYNAYTDVYFQGGPTRVTAQRGSTGGMVTVGVSVVEFDPAYVNVQQGTLAIGNADTGPTFSAISPVNLSKAALVFYHRHSGNVFYDDFLVAGSFSAANQLAWQRGGGNYIVDGHFYVFEARNSEFGVQSVSFGLAHKASSNSATIAAVDPTKSFVIASYRGQGNTDDNDETQLGVWLSSPTTVTARRQWQNAPPPPDNTIDDVRAFVVSVSGVFLVQRGTLSYAAADTQQTATLPQAVNPNWSTVWNGSGLGPGTIETQAEGGSEGDTGFQKLKLASSTTVQGNRGESCASTCAGVGYFEVIDWVGDTTAVTLASFTARGEDSAVVLSWETASELDNLGFHLHRSSSADGPYQRITSSLIPGLGASAVGQSYAYRDTGLTNGATYFYELEDIDTSGKTQMHGPVSAVAGSAGGSSPGDGGGSSGGGSGGGSGSGSGSDSSGSSASTPGRVAYGSPAPASLRVLSHNDREATLELLTPGFFATLESDGSIRLDIPGFEVSSSPGAPALPTRRTWLEAVAGRRVRIASITEADLLTIPGLRPKATPAPDIAVGRFGTVRPSSSPRSETRAFRGLYPRSPARFQSIGFQAEKKKALLELAPLRWDGLKGQLLLARRLRVRVLFTGLDPSEIALSGSRGRRPRDRESFTSRLLLAHLLARSPGLYALRFEDVFPPTSPPVPASSLRLSRLGKPVAFHLGSSSSSFAPGSRLYFLSEGASLNPEGDAAVYELTRATSALTMPFAFSSLSGPPAPYSWALARFEQNRYYQSALLDAPDLWLWDVLVSPNTKSYGFSLSGLAAASEPAHLTVLLQGVSDYEADPDHHLRAYLNGSLVAEVTGNGKKPFTLEADFSPGLLQEGANQLSLENVGDTAAAYSMVFLNRFEIRYPRLLASPGGVFDGSFSSSGPAAVPGLPAGSIVLDATSSVPAWMRGLTLTPSGVVFQAEAGHRYFAVAPEAVLQPEVRRPAPSTLKSRRNSADYLLIAPKAFLDSARALLASRQGQGLRTRAVSIEEVVQEFGYGESHPQAIKDFLAYAYHRWRRPSLRYVLLLGDATYDPKDFLRTGVTNKVPPFMVKTSYLWTASDSAYAQLNGDDVLPDLAVGRLPAANVEEARIMIEKLLAFEAANDGRQGSAVLVADNADRAGSFEQDADEIAASVFAYRNVEKIYLRDRLLDSSDPSPVLSTRAAIRDALDSGPATISYIGHGGIAVWASENIWNNLDVNDLVSQAHPPILLTMNCLNGYFHFPSLNSLAEQFVKAEGKGAVAAFSPSGLSVNQPAHLYHKLLLAEIVSGTHERLGDAILAAQAAYADSGALPELLSIYHLFGDPALEIR